MFEMLCKAPRAGLGRRYTNFNYYYYYYYYYFKVIAVLRI